MLTTTTIVDKTSYGQLPSIGRYEDYILCSSILYNSPRSKLSFYVSCRSNFTNSETRRLLASCKWRTDVETDLKGINRFGNRIRSDEKLYNPETNRFNNTPLEHAQDGTFPLNFNRLHNPPCTLRATGWNRWQPLFHDPQATFEQPFDYFIPSRDVDKKLCRNKVNMPTPSPIPGYNALSDQNKFGSANADGSEQAIF